MAKTSALSLDAVLSKYNASNFENLEFVSTGLRCMDLLLGGGIAPGYCYSLYGVPGAGKSTLTFQIIRSFCKKGKKVIFVDVEKSLNELQQQAFGLTEYVESGQLTILVIGNVSEFDDIITAINLAPRGTVDLVIVDSVSAVREVASADLRVEDVRPGLHARQISFLLGKLKDGFYRNAVASIIIQQARANIQMTGPTAYAPQFKSSGGYAELHIPDAIIKVDAGAVIKDSDMVVVGNRVRISCDKNKFASPKQVISRNLYFGKGISKREEVVEDAIEAGIIEKGSAGFYTLPDGSKVRGMDALVALPNETLSEIQNMLNSK